MGDNRFLHFFAPKNTDENVEPPFFHAILLNGHPTPSEHVNSKLDQATGNP